jgi:hypothetical protein
MKNGKLQSDCEAHREDLEERNVMSNQQSSRKHIESELAFVELQPIDAKAEHCKKSNAQLSTLLSQLST